MPTSATNYYQEKPLKLTFPFCVAFQCNSVLLLLLLHHTMQHLTAATTIYSVHYKLLLLQRCNHWLRGGNSLERENDSARVSACVCVHWCEVTMLWTWELLKTSWRCKKRKNNNNNNYVETSCRVESNTNKSQQKPTSLIRTATAILNVINFDNNDVERVLER